MQNKPPVALTQVETSSSTLQEAPEEPFYEDFSLWVAIVALLVSWLSFRRAGRIDQINRFDKRFGDEIRAATRKLERKLKDLNAFIYPSEKSIAEQKLEIPDILGSIDDANHDVISLLRELDQSEDITRSDWRRNFEEFSIDASNILERVDTITNDQPALFAATIKKSKDRWQTGIDRLRKRLERAKYRYKN